MNEYQKDVKRTLDLLFDAANGFRGRVLDATAVRHVASYIQNLIRNIENMQLALMGADNMLNAYTNEYGEELLNELIAEDAEVVDGIIETEETGFDSEVAGLDASEEE